MRKSTYVKTSGQTRPGELTVVRSPAFLWPPTSNEPWAVDRKDLLVTLALTGPVAMRGQGHTSVPVTTCLEKPLSNCTPRNDLFPSLSNPSILFFEDSSKEAKQDPVGKSPAAHSKSTAAASSPLDKCLEYRSSGRQDAAQKFRG